MSKTLEYNGTTYKLNYGAINHLIPHEFFHCGLSLPAIGLASYIYTLPKCWKLSITHLSNQLMMSKNTCRKYLREIYSNEQCRKIFEVVELEVATYDFEEGFTAYDYDDRQEELEKFTSSVAKDVSVENKKRVMIVQTKEQRYMFNFLMNIQPKESASVSPRLPKRANEKGSKFEHYKKESKDSFKDSSNKTRAKSKNGKKLADFLDLQDFTELEQESIRFWITYKQESARKPLQPAQIDFQLKKITRLKHDGQDIVAVIEKSLENSWAGLFPLRDSALGDKSASASSVSLRRTPSATRSPLSHSANFSSQILESPRQNQNKIKNGKSILGVW